MAIRLATNFGEYGTAADFSTDTNGNSTEISLQTDTLFWNGSGNNKMFRKTNTGNLYATIPLWHSYVIGMGNNIYGHVRFQVDSNAANKSILTLRDNTGSVNHLTLIINADGKVALYRGATNIATSVSGLSRGAGDVNYSMQFLARIHDTTGYFECRMDASDIPFMTFSGDTRNAGNGGISHLQLGGNSTSVGGSGNVYLTDLVIWDESVTDTDDMTTWKTGGAGDMRLVRGFAQANGASGVQFTPLSGSNYSNIDDPLGLYDSDTSYNESNTAGHKDWFTFNSWSSSFSPNVLHSVIVEGAAKKTDAGGRTIRLNAKAGGTTTNGVTRALSTAYSYFFDSFTKDPGTGVAWASTTAVGNGEFGYEIVV